MEPAQKDEIIVTNTLDRAGYTAVARPLQGQYSNAFNLSAWTLIIVLAIMHRRVHSNILLETFVIAGLFWLAVFFVIYLMDIAKLFPGSGTRLQITTRISKDGIEQTRGNTTYFNAWKSVKKVEILKDGLVLHTPQTGYQYIFKRDLSSPWGPDAIVALVQDLSKGKDVGPLLPHNQPVWPPPPGQG